MLHFIRTSLLLVTFFVAFSLQTLMAMNEQNAHPIFVLTEYNPWLSVIGSDSPSFALYGSGEVIYRTGEGFSHTHLTKDEFDNLLVLLNLSEHVMDFESHYELVNATDQTLQIFFVNLDEQPKEISVYGSLRSETLRRKAPKELVALFDVATSFTHPSEKPWLPTKIEVMIWPYEYAPDESIVWPSEWPDINHPETVQRGPEAYSIFLPSEFYFEFKQLLNRRNAKGAVEINGKKWAVSMRFPFPAEHQWMFGFDE